MSQSNIQQRSIHRSCSTSSRLGPVCATCDLLTDIINNPQRRCQGSNDSTAPLRLYSDIGQSEHHPFRPHHMRSIVLKQVLSYSHGSSVPAPPDLTDLDESIHTWLMLCKVDERSNMTMELEIIVPFDQLGVNSKVNPKRKRYFVNDIVTSVKDVMSVMVIGTERLIMTSRQAIQEV